MMSEHAMEFIDKWQFLRNQSTMSRLASLNMTYKAKIGHIAPDFSCQDILTTLYFSILRIDPENPKWDLRDRFILSKGHAVGALYVTLANRGFFSPSLLETYQKFNSKLSGHPDRTKVSGVEHNTGALGHGLSVATGLATALYHRFKNQSVPNVFVLLGDGELQEGSNWEAIMYASHAQLGNLIAIVDHNRLQQGDHVKNTVTLGDLGAKWRSFDWNVVEVDGHDHEALVDALQRSEQPKNTPRVVIANTIKGKGVSFMENDPSWHHKIPSPSEYERAKNELTRILDGRSNHE